MKHHLRQTNILILGGLFLFVTLLMLFTIDASIIGKAVDNQTTDTRLNITQTALLNCSVSLGVGRNTVSLNCITDIEPILDVFPNDAGVWAIYRYIPGSSDPWKVSNRNLGSEARSDLNSLSKKAGYVIIMNFSNTFSHEGFRPFNPAITLSAGWNLVGYPSLLTRNISDAFAGVNISEVQRYNNTAGAFISYPSGTLNLTESGYGYWVNATTADTWAVLVQ